MKRRSLLGYACLFLASCTTTQTNGSGSNPSVNRPETLRFAVTDVSGEDDLEKDFGAFRQALEDVLEIPVEFYPVDDYLAAAPALLSGEIDIAMAGPSEYLLLRGRAEVVPIVGVTRPDYYTLIVTRADSDVKTLSDLKGKTIAMVSLGATAGHISPMKMLMDAGLAAKGDVEIVMLGREGGLPALLNGEVDAWAAISTVYNTAVSEAQAEQLVVLEEGENLPPDVFVANPSLGDAFINEIRSKILANQTDLMIALTASEANQKYLDSELVAADDADYQTLRETYSALGQGSAIE
ncbi:MAG: phosphate/phosphite/phosphonate ABC transporter substrate-binding protein [Spirulinaceae cyanobacterium]